MSQISQLSIIRAVVLHVRWIRCPEAAGLIDERCGRLLLGTEHLLATLKSDKVCQGVRDQPSAAVTPATPLIHQSRQSSHSTGNVHRDQPLLRQESVHTVEVLKLSTKCAHGTLWILRCKL